MTTHPTKITFGELRASGVRDVLIFAVTTAAASADGWGDDARLSDIEDRFT